jgi:hypothetical protein
VVTNDDPEEAFAQLQEPLSVASPWAMPPLLMPLVVAAPFGSGKRSVLLRLVKMLPDVFAVPRVVTSRPRASGSSEGVYAVCGCNRMRDKHADDCVAHRQCGVMRTCSSSQRPSLHPTWATSAVQSMTRLTWLVALFCSASMLPQTWR